ncbi:hypothetical protein [Chakrabartyella piscis]|uniref:hypothetical protein n=1 Tax=Chakrabartyella piscis TaxID=2918914 RepID=UPI0029584EE1|nr:hypothetical protein [Chakrabartyella piscis]
MYKFFVQIPCKKLDMYFVDASDTLISHKKEVNPLNPKISKEELQHHLQNLYETMTDGRNFPPAHVHFLNTLSFYIHFAKCPCGAGTVAETLTQIQHCIPLALTKKSLNQFLLACKKPPSPQFTKGYLEHCKADFLLLVYHSTKQPEQWNAISSLCENLRLQMQEN